MQIIRGRKAVVTAADSPVGRSIALALAGEGAALYLLGRNAQELAATAQAASAARVEVRTEACDLTQAPEVDAAANAVLEHWGCLHILVNNTEEIYYGPTETMAVEEWDRVLSADLLAPLELVRALLPTLAVQDEAHILNVCSLLGLAGTRSMAAYQTSQFGLVGFTAALRAEYTRKGFGMTALCPGLVGSQFQDGVFGQLPAWMYVSADGIGAQAILAIKKNKAVQLVSAAGRLYWWAARLSPRLADWVMPVASVHSRAGILKA
jgi:short-subunit dehydrogenase